MKKCPFCYEEIQDDAIKCKHCGSMLTSKRPGTASDSVPPSSGKSPSPAVSDTDILGDAPTMPSYSEGTYIDGRGRYKVLYKLGEGGMGKVYLTKDMDLDGELRAVKILPRQVANDLKAISRLKDEAKFSMPLNHENIVRLYHYDHEGDVHYLVMEYVNGIDLHTYLGVKGCLPEAEVRRIGIEIAKGLRHAHGQKPPVVHRDIKPANILLESPKLNIEAIKSKYPNLTDRDIPDLTGAKVKLTDFGIARQVRESMSRYSRGDTSGTLMYMSPEQVRGKGVDRRSDLYSLGVTLYELLTGDPPFRGEALAHQILSEAPEPIDGISSRMNDILLRLLSKDKEHRYADADALIRALEGKADNAEEWKKEQQRQEETYWSECRKADTIEGYRRNLKQYLERYPQGTHTSEARAEIIRIDKESADRQKKKEEEKRKQEEDAFWGVCRNENTIEAYQHYLNRFPQGKYVEDAQTAIRNKGRASAPGEEEGISQGESAPKRPGFMAKLFLFVVIVVVGIAVMQNYQAYQVRGWDASAKADLKNAFTSAQAFFIDYPKKEITMDVLRTHGFQPTLGVELVLIGKSMNNLLMVARHEKGKMAHIVNKEGVLTDQRKDAPLPQGDDARAGQIATEKAAEDKAKQETVERAKQETEARAKQVAAEKARQAAEEQAKREAEEARAKQEADAQAKRETEEKLRREEARARQIIEEAQAKREAEAKAKQEVENWVKQNPSMRFVNSFGMRFIVIPAATFTMGLTIEDQDQISEHTKLYKSETQHRVTIGRPFYLQITEVTQGQWKRVMGNNPSKFKDCGDDCPVENVSWNDVQAFIHKLNDIESSDAYRLPTGAEWELAARAGATTRFSWGNEPNCLKANHGNYGSDSMRAGCEGINPGKTMRVGSYPPNAWGLYDMEGNVMEWVQELYERYSTNHETDPKGPPEWKSKVRVIRGGSWFMPMRFSNLGYRTQSLPDERAGYLGFRLVRTK